MYDLAEPCESHRESYFGNQPNIGGRFAAQRSDTATRSSLFEGFRSSNHGVSQRYFKFHGMVALESEFDGNDSSNVPGIEH